MGSLCLFTRQRGVKMGGGGGGGGVFLLVAR